MNKLKDEKKKTNKTTNKPKSISDANKKKEDKELDQKLKDTFPASDSTAEY